MSVALGGRDASRDWQSGHRGGPRCRAELTGLPLQDAVGSREIPAGSRWPSRTGRQPAASAAPGRELAIEAGLGAAAGLRRLAASRGRPA